MEKENFPLPNQIFVVKLTHDYQPLTLYSVIVANNYDQFRMSAIVQTVRLIISSELLLSSLDSCLQATTERRKSRKNRQKTGAFTHQFGFNFFFIIISRSLCSTATCRHESVPFLSNFFYLFTFLGFPSKLIITSSLVEYNLSCESSASFKLYIYSAVLAQCFSLEDFVECLEFISIVLLSFTSVYCL